MSLLKKLSSPILSFFEQEEGEYTYQKSYRVILLIVGILFLLLSLGLLALAIVGAQAGAVLPFAIFFGVALVCIVVSTQGSDRAVAKIWGKHEAK